MAEFKTETEKKKSQPRLECWCSRHLNHGAVPGEEAAPASLHGGGELLCAAFDVGRIYPRCPGRNPSAFHVWLRGRQRARRDLVRQPRARGTGRKLLRSLGDAGRGAGTQRAHVLGRRGAAGTGAAASSAPASVGLPLLPGCVSLCPSNPRTLGSKSPWRGPGWGLRGSVQASWSPRGARRKGKGRRGEQSSG